MTLAAVMLLREHTAEVTRALAESECVEVARTEALGGAEGLHSLDLAGAEAALDALSTRLGQAVTALGAEEADVPAESLRIDPEHVAERVEAEFAPLEAEMAGLVERMRKGREARERADLLAWLVAALEQHGIDPAAVKGSRYIAMEVGSVPRAAMTRVREAAEAAGHKVFNVGHFGARALVVAVTVPEERQDMLDGLTAARFERAEIKEQYFVDGQFVPDAAEMEMWEVREDVAEAGLALVALRKRRGAEVLKWRAEVEANLRLLSAMERYSAGSYTCIIGAWIPTRSLEAVKAKLRERAHDGVEVRTIGFACDQGRHEAHEGEEGGPPTKLSNPWFIRPFEFIVGLYGSPAYDAIDPTPFVALTFVLFFGAMFGDVGHGAVLALLGGLAVVLLEEGRNPQGPRDGACGLRPVGDRLRLRIRLDIRRRGDNPRSVAASGQGAGKASIRGRHPRGGCHQPRAHDKRGAALHGAAVQGGALRRVGAVDDALLLGGDVPILPRVYGAGR